MTTGITKEICAQLSGDVYNFTTPPADWELLADHTNLLSLVSPSFAAGAYYNKKTNEIIIAYRGSEFDVDDWITTNFGGWGCDDLPEQFHNAYDFLNNLKDEINNGDYSSIIGENRNFGSLAGVGITGHSLGGGLAELMGALDICKDYQIYSFNGIGAATLLDDLQKEYAISGDYSNIHNYMVRGDIVSSLFPHLGDDKNYVQATHPTLEKVPIKIQGVATLFYTVTNEVNIKGTHGWDNFIGSNAFQETISLSTYKTVFEILNTTKVEPILTNAILPSIKIFVKALYGMFDEETGTKKWMSKRADIHGNPTGGAASIEGGVSYIVHEQLDNACNAFMTLDLPFIAKVVNSNATDVNEKFSIVVEDLENAQNKLNAIINSNTYVEAYLNGTEFVYDKEKSQNHIWSYTDTSVNTEIKEFLNMSSQLEVSYINENEDGDSIIISDSGNNYLAGGDGNDRYIVGDTFGNDTILDTDGKGSIMYMVQKEVPSESDTVMALNANEVTPATETLLEEMQLYGSSEKPVSKGLWKDCKGNKYAWSGTVGDTLTINDKITVNNFKSGDLGVILQEFPEPDEIKIDPLVLDLDGDGVELVDLENSTAYFDLNADGIKEKTQWVSADDGLLALDRNQNGQIDGIDEVFGNPATIGFDVLNQYDTNGDSVIDSNDTKFSQFKVWQDLNQNGSVDDGELSTLEENNIVSINLNYNQPANADDTTYREYSTVTKTDGSTMTIMDVNLEVSPENTKYDPVAVSAEIAALPQLIGSGVVKDLHSSMAKNSDLKAVVDNLVTQNATAVYQNFDSLLKFWAGVTTDDSTMRGSFSATKAAIVEKFYNRQYTLTQNGGTTEEIPSNKAEHFETLYQSLKNHLFAKFIIETGKFSCLNGITYNDETNTFLASEDKSTLNTAIASFVSTASVEDTAILGIVLDQLRRNYVFDFDSTALSETVEQIKKDALEADSISFGVGQQGNTFILGTSEDDSITDTAGSDIYYTGDGDDNITSTGYGSDVVYSGNGNDTINMKNGNMEIYAGDGDDNITIYDGNTVIEGGLGNDIIKTNYANNVFIFNLGDGQDTITTENSANSDRTDTIRFGQGIRWEDLIFEKTAGTSDDIYSHNAGDDLVISIRNTDDKITVKNWFPNANNPMSSNYDYKIENFVFADNTTFSKDKILVELINKPGAVIGTAEDDSLTGTAANNVFYGKEGNDILSDIYGGNDTYIFNLGDGQDTITDLNGTDKILFGQGISSEDLYIVKDNANLVISIANTDDSITVLNWGSGYNNQIENLEFFDGTVLSNINGLIKEYNGSDDSEEIIGNIQDNIINGLSGADTMIGDLGNDTYIVDNINDTIIENEDEGYDRVESSVSYTLPANCEELILTGTDNINAAGNSADNYFEGNSGNNTFEGKAGNDSFYDGQGGNDTYIYNIGDGNDNITDNSGNDKIVFGDGITADMLRFAKEADNLHIWFDGLDDSSICINSYFGYDNNKIETIEFADGSILSNLGGLVSIYASETGNIILPDGILEAHLWGEGNTSATGNELDNNFSGNSGNNTFDGKGGNNNYWDDQGGDDTYICSAGHNNIIDLNGNDTIKFADGITIAMLTFAKGENNLHIWLKDSDEYGVYVENYFSNEENKIENFVFADGTTLTDITPYISVYAGEQNDIVLPDGILEAHLWGENDLNAAGNNLDNNFCGNAGNNTFEGKHGDDNYWDDQGGNDTYIYNLGDGNDYITDFNGYDTIRFGNGISRDDIILKQCSEHLFINIKETENDIIVNNYFTNEENKIEKIEFADGTNITDIDTAVQEFIGNEDENYLIGNSSDNYFDACEGADTMVGLAGNDTYLVDNENDVVVEAKNGGTDKVIAAGVSYTLPENVENLILQYGNINGTGNFLDNVITGSDENNIMSGMGGNDTYVFNNDWGQDTVIDSEGQNTISIYSEISSNDLTFAMNGNDLEILQLDSLNKITISDWAQNEANRNFTVELNGETAFISSQIESMISQNSNNIIDDSYINMLIQEVNGYGVESEMISMDSGINQNEEQVLLTMNAGMQ